MNMYDIALSNCLVDSECEEHLKNMYQGLKGFNHYHLSAIMNEPLIYIKEIHEDKLPAYIKRYNILMRYAEELYDLVDELYSICFSNESIRIDNPTVYSYIKNMRTLYNNAHYNMQDELSCSFGDLGRVFASMCCDLLDITEIVNSLVYHNDITDTFDAVLINIDETINKFLKVALRTKITTYLKGFRYMLSIDEYEDVCAKLSSLGSENELISLWEEFVDVRYTQTTGMKSNVNNDSLLLNVMVPKELIYYTLQTIPKETDMCDLHELLNSIFSKPCYEFGVVDCTLEDIFSIIDI